MKDCIVIGAGAAGLSAGLTLVRARRTTLLLDAGQQSNLSATGLGGLLGHDRRPPAEFYAAARSQVLAYPTAELRQATVVRASREDDGTYAVDLADGSREHSRTLVLAPGMDYRFPRLPGLKERWGDSAFQCPFCHGWEVQDRATGVLAGGEVGVHGALNLRAWTGSITLLTNGTELTDEQKQRLSAGSVRWDERSIAAFDGPGRDLAAVTFADGVDLPISALLVKSTLYQRASLARDLGLKLVPPDEMLSVEAIEADPMGRTQMPGLFVAGDAATAVPPSMPAAVSSGYLAGAGAAVRLAAGY